MERRRIKHMITFKDRLAEQALRFKTFPAPRLGSCFCDGPSKQRPPRVSTSGSAGLRSPG
jgi:hypothetical protein